MEEDSYKVEIGDGRTTSFWYDYWSELGVLSKLSGNKGVIHMGIRRAATMKKPYSWMEEGEVIEHNC